MRRCLAALIVPLAVMILLYTHKGAREAAWATYNQVDTTWLSAHTSLGRLPPPIKCDIFVAIISGPSPRHSDQRHTQRQTWLSRVPANCFRFFAGASGAPDLRREADAMKDLVFLDLEDVYANLANKTIRMMDWSARNAEFKLLVKTDDDTFVIWDRFQARVAAHVGGERKWLGNANGAYIPHRSGKWAVSWQAFPHTQGPPWTNGFLYAASADCVAFYAAQIGRGYPRLYLEDIDFALAMELHGTRPIPLAGIRAEGCGEDMLATHYQTSEAMRVLWKRQAGRGCGWDEGCLMCK